MKYTQRRRWLRMFPSYMQVLLAGRHKLKTQEVPRSVHIKVYVLRCLHETRSHMCVWEFLRLHLTDRPWEKKSRERLCCKINANFYAIFSKYPKKFPFSHATLELIEKLSFNVNFQLRDRAMHKTKKKERQRNFLDWIDYFF